MHLRRDAFAGAAQIALALRNHARSRDGVTANVGKISVEPGGANVVPGMSDFTIDVRATTAERLTELERVVEETVTRIAAEESLESDLEPTFALEPLDLDPALVDAVERAARTEGATVKRLASGAGHDAMLVGRHVPAAMIFVPSRNGISHSPEEYSDPEAVEVGMGVLATTLRERLQVDR
jgi:allantoate deiminase